MADPTDRDVARLDAWLDGDRRDGDDLTAFASRVMRDAALPEETAEPGVEQLDRMRLRIFGGAPDTEKASPTVHATAFAPNGATTSSIPLREPERPVPSKLSVLMTAALVAIIAVAGFGLLNGGIDLPGGSDDPAPTDMPALAYSPDASPDTETGCSRDQWVSVFDSEVPDLLNETAHATLDDGALTWHCGGESEELATGVTKASGAFWPGVIALVTEDDEARLLNIASDTSIDLDSDLVLNDDGNFDFLSDFVWSGGPEPWVIVPANSDHTDWRVIDLRSMESLLLSDELGGPLPRPYTPSLGQITGTDVAVIRWYEPLPNLPSTPQAGGVNGVPPLGSAALVLPHSIENRRWIEVADWNAPDARMPRSQVFSVSHDGSLLAYTTVTDTHAPVIRVEDAVSGERLVDVSIEEINADTIFMLAGREPRLVYSNGEGIHIYGLVPGATIQIAELLDPEVRWFYPTADPDTILIGYSNGATPLDVESGEAGDFYVYVPNIVAQLFGTYELPKYVVRVVSDELGGTPATVQLVDPATGEVVLESDPVDAHPIQIVSFSAWLRNGGELAVVPIGYNRAVVLDAGTGETWQIAAPVDDDRIWRFYPSYDGQFVTAYPEPPVGTTGVDESAYWIAPLKPGAAWVPFDGNDGEVSMLIPGTPAP